MVKEIIENPNSEQIEEWKKKYGDIYLVSLDGEKCYIKKPSRKDIAYSSKAQDFVKGKEVIAEACVLGGNKNFLTDDDMFFALSKRLDELTAIKETEIEKL